ncbi:MAG: ABC transporter permease [Anaeromyxobacteraceae bacterium]
MTPLLAGLREQLVAFARGRTHRLVLALFVVFTLLTAGAFRAGALRDLPVAVVDLDGTGPSRTVARWLDATPDLRVVHDGPASLEEARAMLASGELTAVVVLPDGLSAALKRGRPAEVVVALDAGNLLTGKQAQKAVQRVLATAAAGAQLSLLEKLGTPASVAQGRALPITVTESLSRNPGSSFATYLGPVYAWFFVHLLLVLLGWATLWPARAASAAERAGRLAAAGLVAVVGGLFTAYVALPLGGLPMPTPLPVLLTALGALAVAELLFVRAVAAVTSGSLFGFQSTVLVAMLSLMVSGLTWPADASPAPLRTLAAALPFTPFAAAVRVFQHEAAGLADLARPLGALALQALAFAAVVAAAAAVPVLRGRLARRPA